MCRSAMFVKERRANMPAFTKVTAKQAAKWESESKPCNHRMSESEHRRCVEMNVARFDRAMDSKKG